jgi:hypothetical protein
MALPCGTTGSLCPAFAPDRPVGLTVKRPYAITLCARLPSVLRAPLRASDTFLEATTPVKLPTRQCPGSLLLGTTRYQSGISLMAPRKLASPLQSLPPMLHKQRTMPMSSCSEGSRGLFVPSRVPGIFTGTTISPSSWLRQCPSRYTIRAGRNLPDKEFRYLRTVIVTAAVYWGFGSALARPPLTFQHRAGVRPYTSSYDFAESCVFAKQSLGPIHCGLCCQRRSFSRSYRAILPSSLAMNHSSTCGYSP